MNNEIIYNEEYRLDPLKEVIVKGFNAGIYDEDYLIKAVGKKDLSKLTKKVITVTRGGKTFRQTVYVRDSEEIDQTPIGEEITPDVKGLSIQQYSDKAIFIGGDTYANLDLMRDIKKEIGVGTYNKPKNGWFFPAKFKETILGIIYSDIFKKGDTDKAGAVKNQKNGLNKGTEVEVNGEKGTIEENVSDSEGVKYNIKTKDGLLEGVDEKVIGKKPEIDDKKISDTINNANPSNRVKTEKQLFGIKPIEDIHKYTLGEYLTMNGLPQEDINKVIAAFRNKDTKKEAQSRVKTGGAKKEYTKVNQTEGLTKRQLIGKLVYAHYQSVQKAIENGEELRPEVLSLYDTLKENYDKKRQSMSEETKRKISEALKKNKAEEIETPKIKKEKEEAKEQGGAKEIDKENYKPLDGKTFEVTSPANTVQREPKQIRTKDYTNIPALDVKIPKQNKILDVEKPYFIPNIDQEKFRRNGYTLPAVKVGEDQYLVALNGVTTGMVYSFSLEAMKTDGYAIMSLDIYAATQKYYQLRAKEELKQRNVKQYEDHIQSIKDRLEDAKKEGDQKRIENLEYNLNYYSKKKPKATRLKMYDKPDKMASDQMYLIQAFNRNEDNNFVSRQEGWRIYREELFADRQQKQIDLDLQAEHDESAFTKGRETSYGDSGTKDDLLNDYGVKVKRQNGDEIKPNEVAQIKEAMDNAAKVFGNNTQMNKEFGLKISHSGDVKQHASKATGIFFPYYSAIGVSNEYGGDMFNFVFGHEYAHFMDYWIGKQTGNHYASDKQGSLANNIASTFRKNMNKKQTSVYQTRTCECFARSLEMYTAIETKGESAIVWGREKYFEAGNYVNKDVYENQVKPLIKQFLNENKDILKSLGIENFYNFNNMEDLGKGLEPDIIKAIEEDQILKSWSTDLQKKHAGSKWVTIKGAKVLVGSGGKVIAAHDELKSKLSKEKKNIKEKNTGNSNKNIKEVPGLGKVEEVFEQTGRGGSKFKQYKINGNYYHEDVVNNIILDDKVKKMSFNKMNEVVQGIHFGKKELIPLAKRIHEYLKNSKNRDKIRQGVDNKVVSKFNHFESNLLSAISESKKEKQDSSKKEKNESSEAAKKEEQNFKEAHKLSKKNLDNESIEGVSELYKNASKIEEKYLSSKTKEKLSKLVDDIYMDSYFGDTEGIEDKLRDAKNIKEALVAVDKLNKELQKEDSFAMQKDMFERTQDAIADALKEQAQKKSTELLNYKLFDKAMEEDIIKALGIEVEPNNNS